MRQILSLSCALCLFIAACGKKDNTDGPQNPNYNQPMVTTVSGLNDTTIGQNDTLEFNIQINYVSGTKEAASINIVNLPSKTNAGIYPQIDTPSYQSLIRIITHYEDTGVYHIKSTVATSTGSKDYFFQLHVMP